MALRQRSELCAPRRAAHPGRRQLAGARDAGGRARRAGLHRTRRGRVRSRTPTATATSTGCMSLGPAALRARRPGERGRDASRPRSAAPRFGAPTEARGRARGRDRRRGAVGRAGAPRLVGHRGGDERAPARPRLHAARPGAQVRGLLPRPRRRAAGERRLRAGDARHPVEPRRARPGRRRTRSSSPTTTSTRVAAAVERYGEGLAAIIVEPVAGNMGVVPPAPGFLEALRALCDASGALLVFDEVITGFRVARGGAQERYGVLPDLTVLGKIVGGGLPLAAFGGRADVMERLAPVGRRLPGRARSPGTRSRRPPGSRVLRRLRDAAVYERARATRRAARGRPRAVRHASSASARWRRSSWRDGAGAQLRGRRRRATRSATARSSGTCSRAGSTSRHRSSRRCSSRSPTATRRSTAPSRPLPTSCRRADLWETIAAEARRESPLWGERCAPDAGARGAVFSPLVRGAGSRSGWRRSTRAISSTTAGRACSRPPTATTALLLGDYLYAHGLVRIAAPGERRRRRGARGADLALRAPARRGRRRRRRRVGARPPASGSPTRRGRGPSAHAAVG